MQDIIKKIEYIDEMLTNINNSLYGKNLEFEYIISNLEIRFTIYYSKIPTIFMKSKHSYMVFDKYFKIIESDFKTQTEEKVLENQFNILKDEE